MHQDAPSHSRARGGSYEQRVRRKSTALICHAKALAIHPRELQCYLSENSHFTFLTEHIEWIGMYVLLQVKDQ